MQVLAIKIRRQRRVRGRKPTSGGGNRYDDEGSIYDDLDDVSDEEMRAAQEYEASGGKSDCGANQEGGGGFTDGNTCAAKQSTNSKAKQNASGLRDAVEKNGGFTYDPIEGKSPKSGFALSLFPEAEKIMHIDDVTPEAIVGYIADNWETISSRDDVHVGAWFNKKSAESPNGDDKVYLDLSVVLDSQKEATALAKENGQLGIYDLANGSTIETMTPEERNAHNSGGKNEG